MDYQLWLGDCLEEMDRIEAGSVDMILADLPFNSTACEWDELIPFEPLWKQYKRVIKKGRAVVLFANSPFNYAVYNSNPEWFKYEWIWNKKQSGSFQNAKYAPLRITEYVMVFGNLLVNYSPQMRQGKMRKRGGARYKSRVVGSGLKDGFQNWSNLYYPTTLLEYVNPRMGKLHPTEKPVSLLSYLIKTYTNEGDTVLDSTCGSGSTLEAAMRCNRRSIGIEKDAHYFEIASQRLARVAAELRGELNHLPMFAEPRPELVEGAIAV